MNFARKPHARLAVLGVLFLATLVFSSCVHFRRTPAKAEAGLTYRWEVGKPLHYEMKSHTEQNMEMMGQSMNNTADSYLLVTLTPNKVNKDGSAEIVFRVDSISANIGSPMGTMSPDLKGLVGKEAVFLVSPEGKVEKALSGAENFEYQIAPGSKMNMSQNFGRMLVLVPGRPVQIGEKWSASDTTSTTQSGLDIQVVVSSDYQAVGREAAGGVPCLKVHGEGEMSMEGSGQNPMAGQMSFEGDGRTNRDYWFDTANGRLVKTKAKFEVEATIAISGQQNMTMPMESVTTLTATLLPVK